MKWRFAFYIVSGLLIFPSMARTMGLSTTFADVLVTDVPVGTVQSIGGPEGRGLVLKNLNDKPLTVRAQVLRPSASQLKAGHVAIPDESWVELEPRMLVIAPHEEASIRIRVSIPKKRRFRGKTFHVMIWSRGEPEEGKGISYNAALLSTLRIRTIP